MYAYVILFQAILTSL